MSERYLVTGALGCVGAWTVRRLAERGADVVDAIEAAAPEAAGRITFGDVQLPFPEELDASALVDSLGSLDETPFTDGVAGTIAFRELASAERLPA
jgi:NAD(P)-dependent dehydrogenase (short-subunit alcohol dehydrogenase family)